jgi:2'-5' RNA ligase
MLRLFVGIPLPPQHRLLLSTICLGLPGLNWVDPGNFHVTIRFIGETDEGVAADIDAALARTRAPAFSLTVAGVGIFGTSDKPRTLYAAVDKCDGLLLLQQRVEAALVRVGLPPDMRRYQPHVTLARIKGRPPAGLATYLGAHGLLRLPPFDVAGFSLIRSYLTKSGSIYEDVAEYLLTR